MNWMENPKRQEIQQVMPDVQSVICVALNYYSPVDRPDSATAKIARYGWGRDYHKVLHKKLKALTAWIRQQGDAVEARFYADTGSSAGQSMGAASGHWLGGEEWQPDYTRLWFLGVFGRSAD
jgi:epoxyqueuosine reductase QueG